jgi:hypothetical protein
MVSVTDLYCRILGFLYRSNKYTCNNKRTVGRSVFCDVLESPEITYCYAINQLCVEMTCSYES